MKVWSLSVNGELQGIFDSEISPGHVVTFPKGWSGRWDVTETIRKVYCIAVPNQSTKRNV